MVSERKFINRIRDPYNVLLAIATNISQRLKSVLWFCAPGSHMLENIDNRAETEVNSTIQTDVSDNVLSISIIISLISKFYNLFKETNSKNNTLTFSLSNCIPVVLVFILFHCYFDVLCCLLL